MFYYTKVKRTAGYTPVLLQTYGSASTSIIVEKLAGQRAAAHSNLFIMKPAVIMKTQERVSYTLNLAQASATLKTG